jgi:hypothetical protein
MQPIFFYIRNNGLLLSMIFGCPIECESERVLKIHGLTLRLATKGIAE